jgi:hypothetical protein
MERPSLLRLNRRHVGRLVRQRLRDYRAQIGGLLAKRRLRNEIDAALIERGNGNTPPLPDFLIIGAPKCATSWLSGALTRQPRILMVPDEIEYFTSHLDQPLQWYLDHFEHLVSGSDKTERLKDGERLIIGEKSAGYCGLSPARIRLVHRLLPNTRLILMVRDPVKRHWSHAKRVFSKQKAQRRGYESLSSRQQLHRFFLRTRRFGEFSKMIENWTDVYPTEQLLIVSQETAFAEPGTTFERVMRHIGAAEELKNARMKYALRNDRNQGPSVPMPPDVAAYLERMFAGEWERLEQVLYARFSPEAVAEINLPRM